MNTRTHWLDEPRNIKLIKRGGIVVLTLTVLAEFVVNLHPHFESESWFGFHSTYGFIACTLMIGGAKLLGLVLKRPDTFYARDDVDE